MPYFLIQKMEHLLLQGQQQKSLLQYKQCTTFKSYGFEFKALTNEDIVKLINKGLNFLNINMSDKIKEIIVDISQGDSRIALNYVEMYNNIHSSNE